MSTDGVDLALQLVEASIDGSADLVRLVRAAEGRTDVLLCLSALAAMALGETTAQRRTAIARLSLERQVEHALRPS